MKYIFIIGIVMMIGFVLMTIFYPIDWSKGFNEMDDDEILYTGLTDGFLLSSISCFLIGYFPYHYKQKR